MSTAAILTLPREKSHIASRVYRWLTHGTVLLADTFSLLLAGALAVFARCLFHAQFSPHDYIVLAPSFVIFVLVFTYCGLYPGVATSPIDESRLILRASTISFLILMSLSFFLREGIFTSRIVCALAWGFTIILVPLTRRVLRGIFSLQPWWGIPTVILGEEEPGGMMLNLLLGHRRLGLRPIAFLSVNKPVGSTVPHQEGIFVGDVSHAKRLAGENAGCYAVVVMPTAGSQRLQALYDQYIQTYQNVLIVPDMFGMRSLSVTAGDVCGILTLKLNPGLARTFPRLMKRAFDLVLVSLAATLVLPLVLTICLAVRLSSRAPIFYGQRRIGKDGKPFSVWKFRSMIVDADQVLRAHLERSPALREEWERDHKLKVDPRVTRLGRLLRKTSLDELPQLWNILCGDMSLVGPRPIVESEIQKYGTSFDDYCQVTPGLTGLWQISGRNNTTYELRIRMDGYYVRNWSLSLDAYILLRTLKTIMLSEGAY